MLNKKEKMKLDLTLQSHEIDIAAYADGLRKELNEAECLYDWIGNQPELTTWRTDSGLWKAELLITYGGPTVTIALDSRYTFGTLRHSWGVPKDIEFEHSGLTDAICEIRGLG